MRRRGVGRLFDDLLIRVYKQVVRTRRRENLFIVDTDIYFLTLIMVLYVSKAC